MWSSFWEAGGEKLFLTGNFLKVSGAVCPTYVVESGLCQDVSCETSRKADQLKGRTAPSVWSDSQD